LHTFVLQVFDFFFPAQLQIANGSYDLNSRDHNVEDHIEPHLIISRTSASMRNGRSVEVDDVIRNMQRLTQPLCTHAERVSVILKNVSKNQILDDAIVITAYCIH